MALGGHVALECATVGEALACLDQVGGVVGRFVGVDGLTAESPGDVTAQGVNAVGLEIAEAGTFDVHGSYP
jgi:hypothetical protein